jgi:1,4-alpha-glucan branching enzyme
MRRLLLISCLVFVGGVFLAMAGCGYIAPRKLGSGPAVVEDGVVFTFYAPSARRVQLAGDWPGNNWARGDGSVGEADIGLMSDADSDGIWEITVALPPGRYKYLFWVDELSWHLDPGSPEEVAGGPTGSCSQVILYSDSDRLEIR